MSTTALVRTGEPPELPSGVTAPRAQLQLLRPIAEPGEIIKVQNETRAFVHAALKPGRDFGTIPGTQKPTLYKPGAERVANGFGCQYGEPVIVDKEIDHDREVRWRKSGKKGPREGVSYGLYRYVLKVPVIELSSGRTVGWGAGAASTMESKYVDRPRDMENTIFKMAAKRARVDACLTTFGLSDEFTQDVEDVDREDAETEEEREPRTFTLAEALEFLFPFPTHAKYGGEPLKDVSTHMLGVARDYLRKKIESGGETADRVEPLRAVELVLKSREGKEGEQRTDPTAPSPAPAATAASSSASSTSAPRTNGVSSPSGSAGPDFLDEFDCEEEERYGEELHAAPKPAPNVPPPAKGATDSVYALTREVRTLLDDPRVPAGTRSEIKRALVEKGGPGQNPAWLAQQRDDLKALLPSLKKG